VVSSRQLAKQGRSRLRASTKSTVRSEACPGPHIQQALWPESTGGGWSAEPRVHATPVRRYRRAPSRLGPPLHPRRAPVGGTSPVPAGQSRREPCRYRDGPRPPDRVRGTCFPPKSDSCPSGIRCVPSPWNHASPARSRSSTTASARRTRRRVANFGRAAAVRLGTVPASGICGCAALISPNDAAGEVLCRSQRQATSQIHVGRQDHPTCLPT